MVDRKVELLSQLKQLSRDYFEGDLKEDELITNRSNALEIASELKSMGINSPMDNLRTAGTRDEGFINKLREKGIIFRKIED